MGFNFITMCLYSKQQTPYVAEKDITVYKILRKYPNNQYISPFYSQPYIKGTNSAETNYPDFHFNGISYIIESGFLHAYTTLKRAEAKRSYLAPYISYFLEIIPMIIPKGTYYYIGDDGDICSETLIWE